MQIDVASANVLDVYHALVGVVTPRPIAWVTTVSPAGVVNLAPFSFFNAFGANPPVVVFSPTLRRDSSKKDTLLNLEKLGEFVIHTAVADLAETVNLTSKEIPPDESEIELAGLATVPSVKVRPPRLQDAPAALECVVKQIIPCGTGPIAANLVIGEVVMIHIADEVLDGKGGVDPRKLKTVARLEPNGIPNLLHGDVLFSGLYLNELLIRLLPAHDPHPALFEHYALTLQALATGRPLQPLLRTFEWRLLDELGYGFALDQDVQGQPLVAEVWYRLLPESGLEAVDHLQPGLFLGRDLRALADADWEQPTTLATAKRLMRQALAPHLGGRPLVSRELFMNLKEPPRA